MKRDILVIGSTGAVGSLVVAELARAGLAVRAATRDPASFRPGCEGMVHPVELDFERPETWPAALAGVERVFLMVRPGDDHADRYGLPLVDEMQRSGVAHVTTLSAMGMERLPEAALHKIERHVEKRGLAFAHLRPNFFMQMLAGGAIGKRIRERGEIRIPAGEARLSYVDARDVAAVAARTLTDAALAGRGYTLTGGESLSLEEIAAKVSKAAGRSIHYVSLSEDEARRDLAASGFPPAWIERLIGFYRLVRLGACAPISPDVATVLGRPPISMDSFARDHAPAWRLISIKP